MLAATSHKPDEVIGYVTPHMGALTVELAAVHAVMNGGKPELIDTGKAKGVPDWVLQTTDPEAMIPVPFIDHLMILISGGTGEKSMLVPVWGATAKVMSQEVRLPSNWERLLAQARET
ncbi:MAG TPA: hypothetical protein PLJ35_02380 [Anaerolineae bacterium]|nr:hypothetical protein [Anaerolineae bacterium]HOQ97650.1 hypothetical protein [Anaerolineae bacterium]HPL29672.1 hypothetical protein [Anaerolineae bacterium]